MRLSDREITETDKIIELLDESDVMRIAMNDENGVYIVPVNYGYVFGNGKLTFFAHGAKEGRKISAINKNENVAVEIDCAHRLHVGESACQYSYFYKSFIGNGSACVLSDPAQKADALSVIMKHVSKKDFEFSERMVSSLSIIKIEMNTYSAKQHLQ